MNPCEACKALAGRPSSEPPHGDLSAAGTGIFGSPTEPSKHYDQYRCTVCGNWLHRNTPLGSPPGIWSIQGRVAGAAT